jgi:hypothetical protein
VKKFRVAAILVVGILSKKGHDLRKFYGLTALCFMAVQQIRVRLNIQQ